MAKEVKTLSELASFAELDCVLDFLTTVQLPVLKANEPPLAYMALQFFFSGLTGYKFLVIANNGEHLLHLRMNVINTLQIHGVQVPFTIIYILLPPHTDEKYMLKLEPEESLPVTIANQYYAFSQALIVRAL